MNADSVFSMVNALALLAWVALAVAPRVRWVAGLVTGLIVPALLAGAYVGLIATQWGGPGGFGSLTGVAQLFANPWMLLAGWIHYLAFDLIVGTWEATDARQRGVPHLLLVPCLLLTFMFGPAGWLLYQVVRRTTGRPVVP